MSTGSVVLVGEIDLLFSAEAARLLGSLEPISAKDDVLKLVSDLRRAGHPPELVAQVATQLRLRHRAKAKFGEFADQMLFTEQGLQQATRLAVAAQHAGRFRAAGIESITDAGCGIGGDSLAFSSLGIKVQAIDADPQAAMAAAFNLKQFSNVEVILGNAAEAELTGAGLWFDPARRDLEHTGPARKMVSPQDYSPDLDWVFQQARSRPTGVKLGPAFPHELIPEDCEAQWVSDRGDLVELVLWFGAVAKPGLSALLLGENSHEFRAEKTEPAQLGEVGEFVYEPDAALIRSGLMGNLANQLGLNLIAPNIAYLSSTELVRSPWLSAYRVLDRLPLDVKKIASWCREHEIGSVEIKKRGVDITPEQLRPKLKLKGTGTATLILTRVGDARQTLICEPIR